MAETIIERNGFRPVVIKDSDDLVGIVTIARRSFLAIRRDHRSDCGR